jgi:hypothetical protein
MQNAETNTRSDIDDESNNENPTETLIHGLIELQQIRDMHDKIAELSPIEGQCSLGIFKEKYAEEMNLMTLFYGDPRDDDITKFFIY